MTVTHDDTGRAPAIDWRSARCRNEDSELFFPAGDGPLFADQIAEATAVCGGCRIREACLDHALEHRLDGIWGGTTTTQRRSMSKRPGRDLPIEDRCGPVAKTARGVERHEAKGEPLCRACAEHKTRLDADAARDAEIIRLHQAGYSPNAAAVLQGCDPKTARRVIGEHLKAAS